MQEGKTNLFKIDNLKEAEKRHQLLAQIVSQSGRNTNRQLNQALKLTTELLNVDYGIISQVDGNDYTVSHHYSRNGDAASGKEFDTERTYCAITLEEKEVVAINYMKESSWSNHPCYELFQVESYLGIPIIVDKAIYGTLNFTSVAPKKNGFTSADKNLIKILGWRYY